MRLKSVLKELNFELNKEELDEIKTKTIKLLSVLKENIKKLKIKADVFVGGSFAKGTLIKEKGYDVDIFVRFYDEKNIDKLEKIIKKLKYEKIHGSRDYFRINNGEIRFEIIPVLKISNPKQAKNVTDLSYFHVNYVKKKINYRIAREIAITKAFFKASGVYGAESYIRGISGYGVECLLIYYKTFEKLARTLTSSREDEKIIIDIEKIYKNKQDLIIDMNESKSSGPIILVDPTYKERNVLAALSKETFLKLKEDLIKFLKKPSKDYFISKEIDINKLKEEAKRKNCEFLTINLTTDRQEGDIAGTKLKKFSEFLINETEKYFKITRKDFVYDEGQEGQLYLIVKPNKEFIKVGPPTSMKSECSAFKSQNDKVVEKKGRLYSVQKINFLCKTFIEQFKEKYADKIKSMDVIGIRVY
jgi:tRNA nucleotidyltransferase (CCA-adding enzyme)